jgi:hypothetical protein
MDSQDHGTMHATRPSQTRHQGGRPRPPRRHDCDGAMDKRNSQIATSMGGKEGREDAPIFTEKTSHRPCPPRLAATRIRNRTDVENG